MHIRLSGTVVKRREGEGGESEREKEGRGRKEKITNGVRVLCRNCCRKLSKRGG